MQGKQLVPFRKTLRIADFFTSDQASLSNAKYNLMGTYTVDAQQEATLGWGSPNVEAAQQGRIFIDLENTSSADQDGTIRLTHSNAQGTSEFVVLEARTEDLSLGATDPRQRLPLPRADLLGFPKVGEDSKINMYFKPDTDAITVGNDESEALIPITLFQ